MTADDPLKDINAHEGSYPQPGRVSRKPTYRQVKIFMENQGSKSDFQIFSFLINATLISALT
jgi:hypothetical protein